MTVLNAFSPIGRIYMELKKTSLTTKEAGLMSLVMDVGSIWRTVKTVKTRAN
jgi:hypothetical protein